MREIRVDGDCWLLWERAEAGKLFAEYEENVFQCSEFNTSQRIALYKNYLLLITLVAAVTELMQGYLNFCQGINEMKCSNIN